MNFVTSQITVDGKTVEVRELSARQRQAMLKLNKDGIDPIEIQAHIIKMGCSEFAESSIDDLLDMPGKAFSKISEKILNLSGLGDESEDDATKNS